MPGIALKLNIVTGKAALHLQYQLKQEIMENGQKENPAAMPSKKEMKQQLADKMQAALPELRDMLGDKKFMHRLKKAAKLLIDGLHKDDLQKKKKQTAATKKAGVTKASTNKSATKKATTKQTAVKKTATKKTTAKNTKAAPATKAKAAKKRSAGK